LEKKLKSQLCLLRSKIHRATVTDADLNYVGSITIDQDLLDAANIFPYEQVHIANVTNGERFMTYAMSGERKSGQICLNGAAARRVAVGDIVIIFAYAYVDGEAAAGFHPSIVLVDEKNRIKDPVPR
jgi:aspartate 1-decarboxylase